MQDWIMAIGKVKPKNLAVTQAGNRWRMLARDPNMKYRVVFILLVPLFLLGGYNQEAVTTSDLNLPSAVISSWGRQRAFFVKSNFIVLEWEQAKELLKKQTYRGGKQYHTGWITIYTHDGAKYLTEQPDMDVFFNFMKLHGLGTQGFATE